MTAMLFGKKRGVRLGVWIVLTTCASHGQIADSASDVVAGIPVNYTEANAGTYTLPDPLKLNNGKQVKDARTWFAKRRPEIRKLIEENWFGRAPGRPHDMWFENVPLSPTRMLASA